MNYRYYEFIDYDNVSEKCLIFSYFSLDYSNYQKVELPAYCNNHICNFINIKDILY